jgi:WD40 repeat protein
MNPGSSDEVNDLVVAGRGKYVISAGRSSSSTQRIYVWEVATGDEFKSISFSNNNYAVRLQLIGDSVVFAAAMNDRSIVIIDYYSGSKLKTLSNAHLGKINGLAYLSDLMLLVR